MIARPSKERLAPVEKFAQLVAAFLWQLKKAIPRIIVGRKEFAARNPSMRNQAGCVYLAGMKPLEFRIVPLSTEIADAARRAADGGASDHAVIAADSVTGYPCRHCLRWALPGERMILFPFAAIPAGRPYAESGPIFVHAKPCQSYSKTREYPEPFRNGRVLRAYNSKQNMIDAEVVNGNEPEAIIEKFLQNPETAFVHVRSVSHGCYTMQVERA